MKGSLHTWKLLVWGKTGYLTLANVFPYSPALVTPVILLQAMPLKKIYSFFKEGTSCFGLVIPPTKSLTWSLYEV